MCKSGFAMKAHREDSSRHADGGLGCFEGRGVGRCILFNELGGGSGPIKLVRIGFMAATFDVG